MSLVLDEVDFLLDQGMKADILAVVKYLPVKSSRQVRPFISFTNSHALEFTVFCDYSSENFGPFINFAEFL